MAHPYFSQSGPTLSLPWHGLQLPLLTDMSRTGLQKQGVVLSRGQTQPTGHVLQRKCLQQETDRCILFRTEKWETPEKVPQKLEFRPNQHLPLEMNLSLKIC
jgi:hypothetical protein